MNIDIVNSANRVQGWSQFVSTTVTARSVAQFAAVLTALTPDPPAPQRTATPTSLAAVFWPRFPTGTPTAAAPTADVGAATVGPNIEDAAPTEVSRGCGCAGH